MRRRPSGYSHAPPSGPVTWRTQARGTLRQTTGSGIPLLDRIQGPPQKLCLADRIASTTMPVDSGSSSLCKRVAPPEGGSHKKPRTGRADVGSRASGRQGKGKGKAAGGGDRVRWVDLWYYRCPVAEGVKVTCHLSAPVGTNPALRALRHEPRPLLWAPSPTLPTLQFAHYATDYSSAPGVAGPSQPVPIDPALVPLPATCDLDIADTSQSRLHSQAQ
ncbi:hypothetical protein GGX14DRAFT_388407 [Mycena pura]|uniref:Uncharacterized protein n=1 Tax=Mycena pura TaxID=153505 RepID=A0AAD7E1R8_9AGAR|nr:hypothetical protein GGX14DRAFT_388407 [Mycena pura]